MSAFNYFGLLASIVFVYWQPSSGSGASGERQQRYATERPRIKGWTPSPGVFGIVWTILYAFMSAALFVYTEYAWGQVSASLYHATVILYIAHIILNKLWSVLFFGLRQAGWALVCIVVMLLSLLAVLCLFGVSGSWWGLVSLGLLVPYELWLLVALYLNIEWVESLEN